MSKFKILIVDDSSMNREMLKDILGAEYEIVEAKNGLEAINILEHECNNISVMLLDLIMPMMDGIEVLVLANSNGWLTNIPVMMISADVSSEYINKAYDLGVTDYIGRPFNETIIKRRVKNMIMLAAREHKLVDIATNALYDKEKSNNIMINILSHIVEFRNGESGSHVIHISKITNILLQHLRTITGRYKLDDEQIEIICMAASLHDIGKIGIPDEILNKPGRLTKEEFEIMKTHSELGAEMLKSIKAYQNEKLVKVAYNICRYHHEKYDGGGYPQGLVGDAIPIAAQVVSVADCYDALTSERCYKKAYTHDEAINMLKTGQCGIFNPLLMQCLLECEKTIEKEMKNEVSNDNLKEELKLKISKLF